MLVSAYTVWMTLTTKTAFFRIPLKSSVDVKGFNAENRWKVIVNTKIEIDE